MKTATFKQTGQAVRAWWRSARWLGAGLLAGLAGITCVTAATVTTLAGFDAGFANGESQATALFNRPAGIALNSTNNLLFVADQDNNLVRYMDLIGGITYTFTSTKISQPVGVLLDATNNVYVLNRGNGNNGNILRFDRFANFKATNAVNLTNATAMTMDGLNNIYVTVQSNRIVKVSPNGAVSTVVVIPSAIISTNFTTITNKGVWLMGITVMGNGLLAVTDAGNNGIWLVNPQAQTFSQFTGFNGAGVNYGDPTEAKFYQPYGIAYAGNGVLVVTDYGNDQVVTVGPDGTEQFFYGIPPAEWFPGEETPGWFDGDNCDNNLGTCAEARNPYGIAVDQAGDVYTTEIFYDLVRKTTETGLAGPGTTLGTTPLFSSPEGIATDPGGSGLYIADQANNAIQLLDFANNQTTTFLTASDGINRPSDVAFDSLGNLYVLNEGTGNNGSILEFNVYGNPLATNATGLSMPTALTVDVNGDIFVTEQGGAVQEFTGATNRTIATITAPDPVSLQGIALFSDGTIAVSDAGNDVVWQVIPAETNEYSVLAGSLDQPGSTLGLPGHSLLNQPEQLAAVQGNQVLAVDSGNNRIVTIEESGAITNVLQSTNSEVWFGRLGDPYLNTSSQWIPMSGPSGVSIAPNGTVYDSEIAGNDIRGILSTGLTPPPPPTPAPAPLIGEVFFTESNNVPTTTFITSSNASYILNNDANISIAIEGNGDSQLFYNAGTTGTIIPDPSATSGSSAQSYQVGQTFLPNSIIGIEPDQTIKAVGVNPGSLESPVVVARVQYIVANPVISGNNAAQFTISDITQGALMYYTTDGSIPTQSSLGPITNSATLSLNLSSNETINVIAFKNGYQPSGIGTTVFSVTNFNANSLTFGFASGEASSVFIGSPGQSFYAPVTLNVLNGTLIYSLQFDMTVTNVGGSPAVTPGALNFQSFLTEPDPLDQGVYEIIPPAMTVTNALLAGVYSNPPPATLLFTNNQGVPFVYLTNVNSSANLMAVGWLERYTQSSLYPTLAQDLIQTSQPHDTIFAQAAGKVVVGGFSFVVPPAAAPGATYQIQLTRPSATSDGIGRPGSEVYIATPTNGSLTNGTINSIKVVSIGLRKYVVGDSAPFRWFNAGDFGDGYLLNDDVEQVFQSAMYAFNYPPPNSDFFDSMDSCCGASVPSGSGYLVRAGGPPTTAQLNALYSGDDTSINNYAFGDGNLDVSDVYVTFRRSLDPSLVWYERFWTNGVLAADVTTNTYPAGGVGSGDKSGSFYVASLNDPAVAFYAGDVQGSGGQTVQIPITARTEGSYPLRVLMLNLTLEPLDGSPPITNAVQFTPAPALGTPTLTASSGPANYGAAWLDSTIPGLSTNALIGTLSVTLPAGAGPLSAYAVHFDHASGSPNGLASFPVTANTGVLTLSDRSSSYFNDGIPDLWRLRHFGTVSNVLSMASADADGDGANNWQEYEAGTDPNDALSVLKASVNNGTNAPECVIHWPTAVGINYIVQKSSSLYGTNWTTVTTNAGTGWDLYFHDTAPGSGPHFYRVQAAP